ncbi:hypothetical protein DGG96_05390 [Legionella qingyii]|uniref:Uncharacterized protein n=1 Tax=Legionella qingyii TaxID=2184757 RepID=A0A317U565_9GAMM|nr:hypothetical protein DGG96_05390 [Legionella qingyii]
MKASKRRKGSLAIKVGIFVIPAKAGIYSYSSTMLFWRWVPAFAGTTVFFKGSGNGARSLGLTEPEISWVPLR